MREQFRSNFKRHSSRKNRNPIKRPKTRDMGIALAILPDELKSRGWLHILTKKDTVLLETVNFATVIDRWIGDWLLKHQEEIEQPVISWANMLQTHYSEEFVLSKIEKFEAELAEKIKEAFKFNEISEKELMAALVRLGLAKKQINP